MRCLHNLEVFVMFKFILGRILIFTGLCLFFWIIGHVSLRNWDPSIVPFSTGSLSFNDVIFIFLLLLGFMSLIGFLSIVIYLAGYFFLVYMSGAEEDVALWNRIRFPALLLITFSFSVIDAPKLEFSFSTTSYVLALVVLVHSIYVTLRPPSCKYTAKFE